MLEKINQFISLFVESFKMMGQRKIWLVLFILSAVNSLILVAHFDFLSYFFYPVITWWTATINETAGIVFSHYPGHYLTLPYYYGLARLLPAFLIEGLILGWVAIIFRKGYLQGANLPITFGFISKKWIHLTGCWLIINSLTMVASIYLPDLLEFFHENSPRRLLAVEFVLIPTVLTIIFALFYYSIAAVAIENRSLISGVGRSLKLFLRRPITSFVMAGIILSGPYLMTALSAKSGNIIDKFRPELVFWILLAGLLAELIANFLWMGTAVRFLLEENQD